LTTKSRLYVSFEIASNISQDSYGLVFGFNTFLALAFQTVLTFVVADSAGLALNPRDQVLHLF
jgi:thiamine transporter 2/3